MGFWIYEIVMIVMTYNLPHSCRVNRANEKLQQLRAIKESVGLSHSHVRNWSKNSCRVQECVLVHWITFRHRGFQ